MPSTKYYALFEESIAILDSILKGGFIAVVGHSPMEKPQALEFTEVNDELVKLLERAPNCYLRGSFTKFPIQYQHFDRGPAVGKYAIDWLAAGPILQFSCAKVQDVRGKPALLQGDVSHQKSYENPETKGFDPTSDEVKEAYRKVVAAIKKVCKPVKDREGALMSVGSLEKLAKREVETII